MSGGPITPNYVGGSAVYYEQLMSLAELGMEVHLLHWAFPEARARFDAVVEADPETWADVTRRCRSVALHDLRMHPSLGGRLVNRIRNRLGPFEIEHPGWREAIRQLDNAVASVQPDFIWAQHLTTARVAAWHHRVPAVYSHHDWVYRIKALAQDRAPDAHQGLGEMAVVRRVDAVVVGSMNDHDEISALGVPNVAYIPLGHSADAVDLSVPQQPMRLVHLGSLSTTANRLGLERFFEVVWPTISGTGVDLWVVGDTTHCGSQLAVDLAKVVTTGFVSDLSVVLRPFDLHVIPWEHATGQRTRVINALRFGQVVLATRSSVSGLPELVDGENCVLVENLSDMPTAIQTLGADLTRRVELGHAARSCFERSFTRAALLSRYAEVVEAITRQR